MGLSRGPALDIADRLRRDATGLSELACRAVTASETLGCSPAATRLSETAAAVSRLDEGDDPTPHLPHDPYWAISPQERFDMTAVPAPTVGQVGEVLDHLDQVRTDPDLPPGIALVWLGRLLESLGAELLADGAGEDR